MDFPYAINLCKRGEGAGLSKCSAGPKQENQALCKFYLAGRKKCAFYRPEFSGHCDNPDAQREAALDKDPELFVEDKETKLDY